jgi:DNA-binding NtrC family response regulator
VGSLAYILVLRPAEEDYAGMGAGSPFPGLIGRSPAMERIFRLVENLEPSEATVLLTGESGAGKEMERSFERSNGGGTQVPLA